MQKINRSPTPSIAHRDTRCPNTALWLCGAICTHTSPSETRRSRGRCTLAAPCASRGSYRRSAGSPRAELPAPASPSREWPPVRFACRSAPGKIEANSNPLTQTLTLTLILTLTLTLIAALSLALQVPRVHARSGVGLLTSSEVQQPPPRGPAVPVSRDISRLPRIDGHADGSARCAAARQVSHRLGMCNAVWRGAAEARATDGCPQARLLRSWHPRAPFLARLACSFICCVRTRHEPH